ncbi:hypothetical protein QO259_00690 [Salinicola sp. JS01]|uniref:DUF7673 family protein n=1 Tax=Salinicola sp. JS01 TaxID=3050071 RepID=UPI00255B8FD0|nr:hypothetical protein [Salinicola sp. JS01]WIX33210.1 hypothetical protein QO259_00690 [Salinicola sp. JS01]
MSTESRKPMAPELLSERIHDRLEQHAAEEASVEKRLSTLELCGPIALKRLIEVAEGHSGQSHHCRRILLAVYNGSKWPLELTRLRCLDRDLQRGAIILIEWSAYSGRELHEYLENGDHLMNRFWETESCQGGES